MQSDTLNEVKRKLKPAELKEIKEYIEDCGNIMRAVEFADIDRSVYKRALSGKAIKVGIISKLMQFCNNIKNS
jgi:hypothetical protein